MFNRSYLPEANLEFAVITDTHYVIDPGDRPLEFESRRTQTHRSRAALELLRDLDADVSFHLGDLVQEYPETPDFRKALTEALDQIENIGITLNHCAGNHDVGDKPDPSMPTHPVTREGLDVYHDRVGRSFYSLDRRDWHFTVMNSQLLNTDLPEASEQIEWVEQDLASASGKRTALFLHLPLYLLDRTDPAFGNYDVVDEPARSQILDLVDRHGVELVCAAHVHFAFFDRMGTADYQLLPSPAFTRPGFSHLFTSPPPPEHGRDDTPKLAFYLFRSGHGYLDRHTVRTSGRTSFGPGSPVITRTARALPGSRMGLTLTHTPTPVGQVPLAYPSIIRQTVRNDYPLLTCQKMGVRHLRVPIEDVADDGQNSRLQILRDKGTEITAICPVREPDQTERAFNSVTGRVDGFELQIARDDLSRFEGRIESPVPISCAQVDPSEHLTGKQHLRTRVGFRVSEANRPSPFDRLVLSVATWESPMVLESLTDTFAGSLDISLDLLDDDEANLERVIQASMLVASLPNARLFCQPYLDLDRTMDVANGFLDPLCNPRPIVTAYRMLNTLLYCSDDRWRLETTDPLTIRSDRRELCLGGPHLQECRILDLEQGTSHETGEVAVSHGLREIFL